MLLNVLLAICLVGWAMVIGWAIYWDTSAGLLLALSLIYVGVYARHLFLP